MSNFLSFTFAFIFLLGLVIWGVSKLLPRFNLFLVPWQKIGLEILGIFLMVLGAFVYGGQRVEEKWKTREDKVNVIVKEVIKEVPVVNKEVVVKYKDKIKYITVDVERVIKEIETKEIIINEGCIINQTAIQEYNKAILVGNSNEKDNNSK